MKEQARFILLVAGVVVAVGGLWLLLRAASSPPDSEISPPAARERGDAPSVAPAPVGRHETPSPRRITGGAVGSHRDTTTAVGQIAGRPQSGIGVVKGEVVWADTKAPVAGAEVIAEMRDFQEGQPPTVTARWRTVTGPNGAFLLEKLPEYRVILDENVYYGLYAQKDDAYGESGFQLTDDEPAAYERIEIYPAGMISGRVVSASGEPVAKAWLSPHRYRPEGTDRDTYAAASSDGITDESGQFTIRNLRPGTWSFVVRAADYVTRISDFAEVGSEDLTVTLERGATVSGTVVNVNDDKPVPDIDVRLFPADYTLNHLYTKAESGADGTFTMTGVGAGVYRTAVRDDEYVLVESSTEITVEQGKALTGLKIPVGLGGAVTGRAYDVDTGEPLENVVIISRHGGGNEAHTDSDGYYRIGGLPEGQNVIGRKWKVGYLHGEQREDKEVMVRLGEVVQDIDFPMKKGLYLRGKVTDRQGAPIEFAYVRSDVMNDSGEGESSQTRADGSFEHRGFSPNTEVTLVASKDGMEQTRVGPLTIGAADLEGIEITMDPGASIKGEVVDPKGNPMLNIHVSAQGDAASSSGDTDAYGRFTIGGLGPGVYTLSMYDYGQEGASTRIENVQRVTVPKAGTVDGIRLVFKPEQGPVIAGRVMDRRRNPIAGVQVSAHGEDGLASWGNTRSDADGRFELTGLKPGRHRVMASDQRYMYPQEPIIAETGDRNVELVLAGKGTVEGRVLDARTGQPIKHFTVSCMQGQQQAVTGYSPYGRSRSFFDEKGAFTLTDVDAGEATLFAQAAGYVPAMQQLQNVDEYTPVTGLVFRLESGGCIRGVVTDESGEPVSGATLSVRVKTPEGQSQGAQAAKTDGRGRFVIDGISAGIEGLYAEREGFLPATVDVRAAAGRTEEVTIRLSRGGTVQGRVTVNGKPAGGQQVVIPDPSLGTFRYTRTDDQGRYSVSGLSNGQVEVSVNPMPGGVDISRNAGQTALVEEGRTTVVDFNL